MLAILSCHMIPYTINGSIRSYGNAEMFTVMIGAIAKKCFWDLR
jgi:hypothetical protein